MPDEIIGFDRQSITRIIREVLHGEKSPRVAQATFVPGQHSDPIMWFPFKNTYAGSCPARSVVRITGNTKFSTVLSGSKDDWPIYTTTRPDTTFCWRYGVTWGEAVAQNGYGLLTFGPTVIVAYDSGAGTPALDEGWGPKPSQFTLYKDYPVTADVDSIYDSTSKFLVADWHRIEEVFCQTQGSIAKNATNGVVEPFFGAPGSGATIVNASMTITGVCNPWEDVADNKKVVVRRVNGRPTLTGKEC